MLRNESSALKTIARGGDRVRNARRHKWPEWPILDGANGRPDRSHGYRVSIVTEDWRFRMLTPAKGDYASVHLNAEARQVADAWDPAKDEAAGNQCRPYRGASVMRVPGRIHMTWENENTLKIETDAGMQTRLLRFGRPQPAAGEPTWQGNSAA
jgi:hypothetical protein